MCFMKSYYYYKFIIIILQLNGLLYYVATRNNMQIEIGCELSKEFQRDLEATLLKTPTEF